MPHKIFSFKRITIIFLVALCFYFTLQPERELRVPDIAEWTPGADVKVELVSTGNYLVNGDSSQYGYQLVSPPINVRPLTPMTLRLPVGSLSGNVAIGILDEKQFWLVPAYELKEQYHFDTGLNSNVTIVITNYFNSPDNLHSSKFSIDLGAQ